MANCISSEELFLDHLYKLTQNFILCFRFEKFDLFAEILFLLCIRHIATGPSILPGSNLDGKHLTNSVMSG